MMVRQSQVRSYGLRSQVDQAYITGDFTYEEADNLASTIRIGGLKLQLEERVPM